VLGEGSHFLQRGGFDAAFAKLLWTFVYKGGHLRFAFTSGYGFSTWRIFRGIK